MDWGFGSPNKTAAFIVSLMVGIWILAYCKRWGFWVALAVFTGLGLCLLHTFSRGGIVALLMGLLPVIYLAPRPWPRSRVAVVAVIVLLVVGYGLNLKVGERFTRGIEAEDKSVTNRIPLWIAGLSMIADSPDGWGLGNSGSIYMQWYEPLDNPAGYRTLVNSHLTWLAEFGWPMRVAYVAAWSAVYMLCWPTKRDPKRAIALGIWLSFGVSSFFSSVAENPWLWIVPGVALIAGIASRFKLGELPSRMAWLSWAVATAGLCMALLFGGRLVSTGLVHGDSQTTVYGKGEREFWVHLSQNVAGEDFGKAWRGALEDNPSPVAVAFVESLDQVPVSGPVNLIVFGSLAKDELARLRQLAPQIHRLILVNPAFQPSDLGSALASTEVMVGEFYQSPTVPDWRNLPDGKIKVIPGSSEYLPDWPGILQAYLTAK